MQTDYTGSSAIVALIEHTQCTKFIISRIGTHRNSFPVFEHLERGNVDRTIAAFNRWASISDNCLPYEIELFNDLDDLTPIEGTKSKKRGKTFKGTFVLNKEQSYQVAPNQPANVSEAIENALMKMQLKNQESELLKRLDAMDQKINDAILGDDEDEEDDADMLSGLQSPAITSLIGLLNKALSKPAPAVNGISDEKKANITKAVDILAKYDENIDTDLLKLASIAENNNATFNMLLSSLRSM